jgi:predicted aldo/keto reductase-like oxidoreductase
MQPTIPEKKKQTKTKGQSWREFLAELDNRLINRRHFMKSSVSGMAGFYSLPFAVKRQDKKSQDIKLIYRTLVKTGIRVPVIGMGILSSSSPALMRAALDAGISHFDTTAGQPHQIRNEEMIGEVLKGVPRESVVFGTKVHLRQDYKTGLYTEGATEDEFLKQLDMALKRLKMDYVDIIYHHMVSRKESAFHEPVMKAMEKVKKSGKARFLGITTHSNVPEVVHAAADSGFYEVVMAAYNYRQKDHKLVKEAIARAADKGLGVVAIKVIRGDLKKDEKNIYPSASLKWVLQDSHVHATVPAFSNFEEMSMDLSVMEDLKMTDVEQNHLKRVTSVPGLYCQGCGKCLQQCSEELPIPDLMRAYMYAYGYQQPVLAQNLMASLDIPGNLCEGCSSCPVVCLNGWNVAEKIRDIIRLRDLPSGLLV